MSEQIYEYMRENTDFELPTNIVAEQANSMLQRQYAQLIQQGLGKEQLQEKLEDLKASSEDQAAQQLKTFFIMDKVADQLGIEVTDEEINGQIARLAMQQGQRPEQMRDQMEQNGTISQFKLRVREEKCISKLLENADINEKEPEDKDESEDDSDKGKGKKKAKKKKSKKKTKKSKKKKKKKKSKKKSSE
jgi:trigger factor